MIGAGPAGLAVAGCLGRAGVPCLVLEQSDRIASAWHRHYERLHLHTAKRHSSLPGIPFAAGVPRYPSRSQFIDYLDNYARALAIAPRFGQRVESLTRSGGGWEVRTADARYQAARVVIATGNTRVPNTATWPTLAAFRGEVLHSGAYRNGSDYRGRRVLVVGLGNSGGEIALDLCEHGASASIAVRSPVNVIPRDLLGIPILTIAIAQSALPPRLADRLNAPVLRAVVGDLARFGLRRPAAGPLQQIREGGRIPLLDVGTVASIRQGKIGVYPAVDGFSGRRVHFADGRDAEFDVLVLATGFRPRVDQFLADAPDVLDADGSPTTSGRESPARGLYFCGFRVAATGMLREIGIEAGRIASAIASAGRG